MLHNFEVMAGSLGGAVVGHLSLWEGWAAVIAGALFGWRTAPLWMPLLVALIINPEPFGLVADLIHGRRVNLYAAVLFTLGQIVLAYAGFFIGRLLRRIR